MNNNSKKWFDLLIGCKITQNSQKQSRNVTFLISFNIEKVFFIQILSLFFTTCLKSDFSSRYMSGMENRNWSNSLALPFFPIRLVSRRLRMLVTLDLSKGNTRGGYASEDQLANPVFVGVQVIGIL